MSMFTVIIAVGLLGVLFTLFQAFRGPSVGKAAKRRVEMIKERHTDSILAANAQAQIRKLMAARQGSVEGFAMTLIPKPALLRKRLEQTGKNWTLGRFAMSCLGIVVLVAAVLMMRGMPFLLALFVGLFIGIGFPISLSAS